ncbi:hypothetical protein PUN28_017921 [Cardiocondyla obscurior]|uniref:Uncharacterized protein n=1 Tax=Cardiocondyla obscurior TaxID=286306 RepID=A0AAW2EJH7_9HYME
MVHMTESRDPCVRAIPTAPASPTPNDWAPVASRWGSTVSRSTHISLRSYRSVTVRGSASRRPRRLAPPRKPRSKEDPQEAKARDRARIPEPARERRYYGSNLPTSLTYISLSTRGSLPWRPAADMGTNRRDTSTWPSP